MVSIAKKDITKNNHQFFRNMNEMRTRGMKTLNYMWLGE